MQALDHKANVYIAVSIQEGSQKLSDPSLLTTVHPALAYVGPVGQLGDVQLVSVARDVWEDSMEEILRRLNAEDDVQRVDVQSLKMRVKRGDEL